MAIKSSLNRRTAVLVRWLHIYLSMASFAIVFFFAVTGLTLNHADKFAGRVRTVQKKAIWMRPGRMLRIRCGSTGWP